MFGRKRRSSRISAEKNWLGNTPCRLLVLIGSVGLSGSGQKIPDCAGGIVLQKLFGLIRFAEKPELASGFKTILVISGLELPAGKDWTTPCFPRSRPSPLPSKRGSLKSGLSSAKNWVTKTVVMFPGPLSVIAMALGLPPTWISLSANGASGLFFGMTM